MKISIVTLFPEMFTTFLQTSIIKRAVDQGLFTFNLYNLFDTVEPKVRVDAHTVGPGPGMVIKPEVLEKAILDCEQRFGSATKIFFSPQGEVLNQTLLRGFLNGGLQKSVADMSASVTSTLSSVPDHIILVCLRYEGTDSRVEEEFADKLVSVGDYVLMGGELPAQVFLEAFTRLLPGVLGNEDSVCEESFETPFLDHPSYCKPDTWRGREVPAVLTSGNHSQIRSWRLQQAVKKTLVRRFDWFRKHPKALEFRDIVQEHLPSHYCVIMHDHVLNKEGLVGTSSIKAIDLHDISRAAKTYGFKGMFVVQPLKDQQEIAKEFFSFWTGKEGQEYNQSRCVAVEKIVLLDKLADVIENIREVEGECPLVISTSAKPSSDPRKSIGYHDQGAIWSKGRPVLLVFGTAYGLSQEVFQASDFVLDPLVGLSEYNHLSVRAAAAIIFDRWLGMER